MYYNNNSNLGCILKTIILALIGLLIISNLLNKYLIPQIKTTNLFWVILISIVVFYLVFNSIKERVKVYRLTNRRCIHGVKNKYICENCIEEQREKKLIEGNKLIKTQQKRILLEKSIALQNKELNRLNQLKISTIESIINLTPREFENLVAEIYKKMGFRVIQTPYTNDKGKDLILYKEGKKFLVECKKYAKNNTVGREALQKFFAAILEEDAEMGYFITTSSFKYTSLQYSSDIKKIDLIDGDHLFELYSKTYHNVKDILVVKVMCENCGDIVSFNLLEDEYSKNCKNNHMVNNFIKDYSFDSQFMFHSKYCIKCGELMKSKLIKGKRKWVCNSYPDCKYRQD